MFAHTLESWFAVQVAPRHEKSVATLLSYKGYQHFLPTYRSRRAWSDRSKTIEVPMFPGYVFCRTMHRAAHGLVTHNTRSGPRGGFQREAVSNP